MDQDGEETVAAVENPIQEINASIDLIVGQTANRTDPGGDDYGAPDVIRRGVLTTEECQELFELYVLSRLILERDEKRRGRGREGLRLSGRELICLGFSPLTASSAASTLG
jgi:hypothetical protein